METVAWKVVAKVMLLRHNACPLYWRSAVGGGIVVFRSGLLDTCVYTAVELRNSIDLTGQS